MCFNIYNIICVNIIDYMKKSKVNLPQKLIHFKSSDKSHHQEPDYNDLANCCSPTFCLITNNVNCGKSSLMKNLLVHKNPPYERIVIYSPLGEYSSEYTDDLDCELLDNVPDFEFFDKEQRNCFIVEDCDVKSLNKQERHLLGRYFGVYASHNNIDIYCISQNLFDMLPSIRRLANIVFLFKNNDDELMTSLARKFHLKPNDLKTIFKTFTKFDSLCIDDSRSPEYHLRKNIYEIIKLPQLEIYDCGK